MLKKVGALSALIAPNGVIAALEVNASLEGIAALARVYSIENGGITRPPRPPRPPARSGGGRGGHPKRMYGNYGIKEPPHENLQAANYQEEPANSRKQPANFQAEPPNGWIFQRIQPSEARISVGTAMK